jgi:hypothetical protein
MDIQRAEGTFTVVEFTPLEAPPIRITAAMTLRVATIEKSFTGSVEGRSTAIFTGAQDPDTGAGSYVALEVFQGSVDGRAGTFIFAHAASTHGEDRYGEVFVIVDGSGTGELAGISGGGSITIDADGTHRIRLDYELPGPP